MYNVHSRAVNFFKSVWSWKKKNIFPTKRITVCFLNGIFCCRDPLLQDPGKNRSKVHYMCSLTRLKVSFSWDRGSQWIPSTTLLCVAFWDASKVHCHVMCSKRDCLCRHPEKNSSLALIVAFSIWTFFYWIYRLLMTHSITRSIYLKSCYWLLTIETESV